MDWCSTLPLIVVSILVVPPQAKSSVPITGMYAVGGGWEGKERKGLEVIYSWKEMANARGGRRWGGG